MREIQNQKKFTQFGLKMREIWPVFTKWVKTHKSWNQVVLSSLQLFWNLARCTHIVDPAHVARWGFVVGPQTHGGPGITQGF